MKVRYYLFRNTRQRKQLRQRRHCNKSFPPFHRMGSYHRNLVYRLSTGILEWKRSTQRSQPGFEWWSETLDRNSAERPQPETWQTSNWTHTPARVRFQRRCSKEISTVSQRGWSAVSTCTWFPSFGFFQCTFPRTPWVKAELSRDEKKHLRWEIGNRPQSNFRIQLDSFEELNEILQLTETGGQSDFEPLVADVRRMYDFMVCIHLVQKIQRSTHPGKPPKEIHGMPSMVSIGLRVRILWRSIFCSCPCRGFNVGHLCHCVNV